MPSSGNILDYINSSSDHGIMDDNARFPNHFGARDVQVLPGPDIRPLRIDDHTTAFFTSLPMPRYKSELSLERVSASLSLLRTCMGSTRCKS